MQMATYYFSATSLALDPAAATERIVEALRLHLAVDFKRKGYVVGLSGGVDSSVSVALAVRALGPKKVFGLFMPEHESDPDSLRLGKMLADQLGEEVERSIRDVQQKRKTTRYLHMSPRVIESVIPETAEVPV